MYFDCVCVGVILYTSGHSVNASICVFFILFYYVCMCVSVCMCVTE